MSDKPKGIHQRQYYTPTPRAAFQREAHQVRYVRLCKARTWIVTCPRCNMRQEVGYRQMEFTCQRCGFMGRPRVQNMRHHYQDNAVHRGQRRT